MGNTPSKVDSALTQVIHPENVSDTQYIIKNTVAAFRQALIINIPNSIFEYMAKQGPVTIARNALRRGCAVGSVHGLFAFLLLLWTRVAPRISLPIHSRATWFALAYLAAERGISIENFRSKSELAVFNAQQAFEVLFRMLMSRGYLPNLSFGPILLWTLVVTLLYKLKNFPKENLAGILKHFIPLLYGNKNGNSPTDEKALAIAKIVGISSKDKQVNYVIAGISKSIVIGTFIGTLISLIFALRQSERTFGKIISEIIFSRITSQFITYFMFLIAGPRVIDVLLEKSQLISNEDLRENISGIFGGISSGRIFLSADITMYVGSKVVETFFVEFQNSGIIPKLPSCLVKHLYALSIALIFTGFAFEPHNLRPSTFSSMITYSGGTWAYLTNAFSKIRSENGIPNPVTFQKWFEQVATPLIKATTQ